MRGTLKRPSWPAWRNGRRSGLKIRSWKRRGGSSPPVGRLPADPRGAVIALSCPFHRGRYFFSTGCNRDAGTDFPERRHRSRVNRKEFPSMNSHMRFRGALSASTATALAATLLTVSGAQTGRTTDRVQDRPRRHHPVSRLLRDRVRRPPRTRPPYGGGVQRCRLCQHLERPLLPQRHAAAGRLPDRAAGHQG